MAIRVRRVGLTLWPGRCRPRRTHPKCEDDHACTKKPQLHPEAPEAQSMRRRYLRVNDHPRHHAQIIMKSTEVIERTRRLEGHPEPRHAQRQLRQSCPVLECRNKKP